MSLNAFKEALKPCKTNISSSSPSSSQISQEFDTSIISRKPPKSTIARQLLRLQEDTDIYPQIEPKNLKRKANLSPRSENVGDNKLEEKKAEKDEAGDTKREPCRYIDHTGPYEPLVLSLPGEFPVVQVVLG